ncbi:MAG: YraN family protein [Leucobacter sp.]|nr:YraN family protein [Leucobacter sp.]
MNAPDFEARPAPRRTHNQTLGARGETLAAEYLAGRGFVLLERNWRSRREGELDIVARDGAAIVAVEVKARSGTGTGHPLEAITWRKAHRLRGLLLSWMRAHGEQAEQLRVDAIGIVLRAGAAPEITHLRGIA